MGRVSDGMGDVRRGRDKEVWVVEIVGIGKKISEAGRLED